MPPVVTVFVTVRYGSVGCGSVTSEGGSSPVLPRLARFQPHKDIESDASTGTSHLTLIFLFENPKFRVATPYILCPCAPRIRAFSPEFGFLSEKK